MLSLLDIWVSVVRLEEMEVCEERVYGICFHIFWLYVGFTVCICCLSFIVSFGDKKDFASVERGLILMISLQSYLYLCFVA